jgi:Icc-related predicted phosphoesterase
MPVTKRMALFASDLHGNRYAYERIFQIAKEHSVQTIILGGDLTPKWPILSFGSGALVPLHPKDLRVDENGDTYADFLTSVEPLAKLRTKAEKHYTNLGGYLQHTGVQLSWRNLLGEQRALAKVHVRTAFRSEGTTPILTDEEWRFLEPLLRRAMKARRDSYPDPESLLFELRVASSSSEDRKGAMDFLSKYVDRVGEDAKDLPLVASIARLLQQTASTLTVSLVRSKAGSFQGIFHVAALEHPLHDWINRASSLALAVKPQKSFLEQYFTRWLKRFREELPNVRVFLILGNDDVEECNASVQRIEEKGLATVLHSRAVDLGGGLRIAGYPHVPNAEQFYPFWQKPEEEILEDLKRLEAEAGDPATTVFVVHCPPGPTSLDTSFGGQHFGSRAVRTWLAASTKRVVLSGHIHEAPFMPGGAWTEVIDGTPCYQPGGWHDEGLCAVLLDLDAPQEASWIQNLGKPQPSTES